MSEKKDMQVDITERKINIQELMKESNVILIEENKPNMRLMARAWLELMNQSL